MQSGGAPGAPAGAPTRLAPPYPAELVIPAPGWSSPLARDGVVSLSRPEVHLGVLGGNDVVFSDPHVSRLHAVIRWTPTGYEIEDLNSTGGTYVQGRRVFGRAPLQPGETLRLAAIEMLFRPAGAAPAPGPVPDMIAAPPRVVYPPVPRAYAPYAPYAPAALARPSRLGAWFARHRARRYWKVFLLGLLAYIAATLLVSFDLNRNLVPLVILLASALVPVTFVMFCWEEGAFRDMSATVVGLTFVGGAVLGLLAAALFEDLFLLDVPILGVLTVGVIEEAAKAGAAMWFLRDHRLRSELDGLVLGAAAGMGFATLETAGYGFNAFLRGYTVSLAQFPSVNSAVAAGIASMTFVLILRMALAVFGHGVWTAIVCAAIWRDRGQSALRVTPGVLLAFGIAVLLHALWDSVGAFPPLSWLFLPFVAVAGLWILRFFIHEAVDRAKLGTLAPPPVPLAAALLTYLRHPLRRPTVRPEYPHGPYGHYAPGPYNPAAFAPAAPSASPPQPWGASYRPADDPAMGQAPSGREFAAPPAAAPALPGRMCPNGHFVTDGRMAACPWCGAPLPGMPPYAGG